MFRCRVHYVTAAVTRRVARSSQGSVSFVQSRLAGGVFDATGMGYASRGRVAPSQRYSPTQAWNKAGPMGMAAIAHRELTQAPSGDRKVVALLRQHPDFATR